MSRIQNSVVVLSAIFSGCFGFLNDYHFAVNNALSFAGSISHRTKRGEDCTTNCAVSMMDNMKNKAPDIMAMAEQIQDSPAASITKVSKDKFVTYCQDIMKPFLSCIDACDSNQIKTLMQESLKIVKVMCVDRYQDMLNNYECLNKTEGIVKQECVSNKCPNLEDSVKPLVEFKKTNNRDMRQFSQIMGDFCEATSCSLPCMKNVTSRECGEKIAKIATDEMIGTAMTSLKTVFSMAGGQITFPDKCEKVIRDTTGNDKSAGEKPMNTAGTVTQTFAKQSNPTGNTAATKERWISFVAFMLCLFLFV